MKQPYVSTLIDQTDPESRGFTDAEKKTARDNIAASQVKYVRTVGGYSDSVGDLAIVRYESGLHMNDGSQNIAPLPPETTQADKGKVLAVDKDTGYVGWKTIPNPRPNVFIKQTSLLANNNSGNTTVLNHSYELPVVNGKYPSKVIGYFDVKCNSTGATEPSISVCMTQGYHTSSETDVSWDPVDQGQNANFDELLGGDLYANHRTFSFDTSNTIVADQGVRYLTFKGRSDCAYNIQNLRCQCFYEDRDTPSQTILPQP